MRIMAIDQARNGAWSIFEYEKKELVAAQSFSYPTSKYTFAEATMHIEAEVERVMEEYGADAVFIEDIQFRQNIKSFKRLAQLQGVLVNLFEKKQYLYDYVPPVTWQSYCNARSRTTKEKDREKREATESKKGAKKASKMLSIHFVAENYGIETEDDNLSDAICIGHYVVNNVNIIERKDKNI